MAKQQKVSRIGVIRAQDVMRQMAGAIGSGEGGPFISIDALITFTEAALVASAQQEEQLNQQLQAQARNLFAQVQDPAGGSPKTAGIKNRYKEEEDEEEDAPSLEFKAQTDLPSGFQFR